MHMQRMLEMSRVLYTARNFKQNVWINQSEICDNELTINDLVLSLLA